MRTAQKPLILVAAFVVLMAAIQVALQGHDRDQPLVLSQFVLEKSRDIDRLLVEDTYRARVTHTGGADDVDYARVTAKVAWPFSASVPGILQVVDGDLAFGAVRAGETVNSVDTITIRRLRYLPLKPIQLRWIVDGRPDLVLPDEWAGQWRFTLTYKDGDTGDLSRVSNVTGSIGTSAPLGLSLLPGFARCEWSRSESALGVDCSARARIGGCATDATARFALARDGSVATGQGEWRITHAGDCGDATSGSIAVEIAGTRIMADIESDPLSPGLLPSFVTVPGFSSLIADSLPKDARR